jgi:hypothetical protein
MDDGTDPGDEWQRKRRGLTKERKIEQNGQKKKKKGAKGLGRFERRKHSQTSARKKEIEEAEETGHGK